MAVPVQSDLVPGFGDHAALLGESFEAVPGDEKCRLDVVLFEHLEEAPHPDRAGEHAARDVAGAVFAAVGAEPAGDGVDVDGDAALDFWEEFVSRSAWEGTLWLDDTLLAHLDVFLF